MDAASDVHRGGLDDSHACPICRETFSDAFNTMCGHTFCYACIVEHLARAHACPCCAQPLTAESLFPNLALDKLLKQLSRSGQLPGSPRCPARRTKEIAESINSLPLEELTPLLRSIADKHDRLVKHDKRVSVGALRDFLALSWKRKNDAIRDLEREVGRIDVDVNWIERQIDELGGSHALRALVEERAAATAAAAARAASPNGGGGGGGGGGASAATAAAGREPGEDPPPSPHQPSRARASAAASMSLASVDLSETKRARVLANFANLQDLYSKIRCGGFGGLGGGRRKSSEPSAAAARGDLDEFANLMRSLTKYERARVAGEVRHGERNARLGAGASSIVSSIEFDRDYANFATGGVSKKVHVFSFAEACGGVDGDRAASDVDAPGPIQTLDAKSKLSCLSYNKHVANHLASSDYEGVVTVWDVEAGVAVAEFEEHDKRAWTVDYCRVDPRILASGSDDGLVKIWSTAQRGSVLEIDVRANVCCVQYGPLSAHQLAVGSADHRVHVFDLRNPSEAIATLRAHRKAVSYVRFLPTGDEMVSASTDSTLCVWDVKGNVAAGYGILSSAPAATLEGHVNEKNFVGLSVGAGELIACGSETNEAYVYHKSFNRPILTYDFAEKTERRGGGGGGGGGGDSGPLFVSATCWRGDEPVLLAANSTGSIKVLQLVE
ncbi:uncharacterized protein MICPUCDRAFT_30693 [Micromonas pusilla CCMP1545]|uniref:Predicted protein n=1 Tax=Micromonas pusilla (strain CCMP1545) TaxID=564608 RepID=C1MH16_MICPC|nr:uncharacterized protein MICPUCDRAFT_30693 [Micromonas pusilla CCMP1545]EEH60667.1 predicted protein [Micromonas pusilla CCMP1545]|eukprot:XP_003055415.1 predicted protein [Micromonas pusilla CCMP1545]